jgi:hypothetical protein
MPSAIPQEPRSRKWLKRPTGLTRGCVYFSVSEVGGHYRRLRREQEGLFDDRKLSSGENNIDDDKGTDRGGKPDIYEDAGGL